jgi:hypothetical protein
MATPAEYLEVVGSIRASIASHDLVVDGKHVPISTPAYLTMANSVYGVVSINNRHTSCTLPQMDASICTLILVFVSFLFIVEIVQAHALSDSFLSAFHDILTVSVIAFEQFYASFHFHLEFFRWLTEVMLSKNLIK